MNRRGFVALIGGALAAPRTFAQQAKVWRIGFLAARSRSTPSSPDVYFDAFVQGMRDLGYVEGRNLVIEWRAADGKYERLPGLAAELVKLKVEVIVTHSTPAAQALQGASKTVPVVFISVNDPLESGLVRSLARPGGNLTGLSNMIGDLSQKQLELLKLMNPALTRVAVLLNPGTSGHVSALDGVQSAARLLGIETLPVRVRTVEDIERGFDTMARERAGAVIVTSDSFLLGQRAQIAKLAVKYRLPSIYATREYALDGGLMGYGPNLAELYRRGAIYVDKIFKGAKPGELPIEQPTQLELMINAKTAKAIGISIPQSILLRADRVIE